MEKRHQIDQRMIEARDLATVASAEAHRAPHEAGRSDEGEARDRRSQIGHSRDADRSRATPQINGQRRAVDLSPARRTNGTGSDESQMEGRNMYFAALQDHPLGQFGVSVGGATYSPVTTRRALQELDYDPYHATRAGLRIPRRFAESLPTDISGCRRMTERQQAFVTILLPIVLRANEIVGLRDAVARARVGVDAPAVPSDLPPSLLIGLAAAVTDWGNDLTSSKASNPYPETLTVPYGLGLDAVRAAGGISRARHNSLLEATLDIIHGLDTLVTDPAFRREQVRQHDSKRPDGYRLALLMSDAGPCDRVLASDVLYAIEGAALTLLDRSRLTPPTAIIH